MRGPDAVWITGVGTATPLGTNFAAVADAFLAGRSGVRPVTRIDLSQHPCRIAGDLDALPAPPGWDEQEFTALGRPEQLILWCAVQALRDAGWWEGRSHPRLGLVLGNGAENILSWEMDWHSGVRSVEDPAQEGPALLDHVKQRLGMTGPATLVAAACASGNVALAVARRWLALGLVDACLAGGCDRAVTQMCLGSFGNLGALSSRNEDPRGASRPFDRGRDGLVLGEGGALFMLEPAAQARRRGAHAYAELAGYGASSDAYHMVIPSTDAKPATAAMRQALADAALNPDEVDYVNAHATSTPVGDAAESRALKAVFGEGVARVPVSGTKSMTGHALSGAAAIDAVACLAALERQALPPTINLTDPDPECDLCHVPNQARPQPVRVVLSNSFGFGGSNTSVVLRKVA
jgi:3-oxoacyl-[acyl-carrier-protein] synthase II